MKKIYLIFIAIFLQFIVSAEEILKDIETGRVFLMDTEGYIYVNSGSHSIAKYSPAGKLLLKMGQKGEGPSDIKRMGWFAINPIEKNIYVTEFLGGNKWLSKFSKEGKFMGEFNCEIDWKKWHGISFIQFDDDGNIYLQLERSIPRRYKDFTIGTMEKALVKFSTRGKKLKEIYKIKTDFWADKGGKGNITIPFHNYLYWKIYNDNIIVKECKKDYISIFDLEGNLKKKVFLPFKKEKVAKKDLDDWEEYLKSLSWVKKGVSEGWFDLKYWRSRLPFPEYKLVSGGQLYIDPHGYLYTMKYSGYKIAHSAPTTWAKINLSKYDVSIVFSNPREWPLCDWRDNLFIKKLDEDDNYVVVKVPEGQFFKEKRELKWEKKPKPSIF